MSKNCSCIVCKKEFSIKGFHSHYVRSHTKEGNELTRIYGKSGNEKFKNNVNKTKSKKIENYYKFPKLCSHCNSVISYEKRFNNFCSRTCVGTYSNNIRKRNGYLLPQESRNRISLAARHNMEFRKVHYSKVSFCVICNKIIPFKHQKTCSKECLTKRLSENAKNIPQLGGNKNNHAYGWYNSPFAGNVWLESSYEYKVAVELDSHKVNWCRPDFFKYTINNNARKYFPDFYLVDYNVYLDPKNDFLIIRDEEKIKLVIEQNNINLLILDKFKLTWTAIKMELSARFELA